MIACDIFHDARVAAISHSSSYMTVIPSESIGIASYALEGDTCEKCLCTNRCHRWISRCF